MRVEFLQRVDVDMAQAPKSAYSQITTHTEKSGSIVYCFRVGACPDLPEELARQYVASGLARFTEREFPLIQSRDEMLQDVAVR